MNAAKFVTGVLSYKKMIENQEIPAEYMQKTTPMCMHQYSKVFTTNRVPGVVEDKNIYFTANQSIAVISNKQFYIVDVIQNGKQLTTQEIE